MDLADHPFRLARQMAATASSLASLSSSDCESIRMSELLEWADDEVLRLWEGLTLAYGQPKGLPLLREEIAKSYDNIEPHQVVVCAPQEGIMLASLALLERGDTVICPNPLHLPLQQIPSSMGCRVLRWRAEAERTWRFDPGFIREVEKAEVVITNFPNNPSGAHASQDEFRELLAAVESKGSWLFSDEMFRGLEARPEDRLPAAVDVFDRSIVLGGMSKAFGAPGTRIGWLVTRDADLLARVDAVRDYTTSNANVAGELLALMALRNRDRILERNRRLIARNQTIAAGLLESRDDLFQWLPPEGGSTTLVRVREGSAEAFCRWVAEQASIALLPSTMFEFDDGYFRVGLGRQNLPELIGRLAIALAQLNDADPPWSKNGI